MLCRTYIRAYRLAADLKQMEMADKLGVRMATYKSWEYGFSHPQSQRNQMKLVHFFGKTLPIILGPAMLEEGEVRSLVAGAPEPGPKRIEEPTTPTTS